MATIRISKGPRTKVFIDEQHIKTIPLKYASVFKKKHITNNLKKRLTREERFNLEVSIWEVKLKKEHPYAYDLIKRSFPNYVRNVSTPHSRYYELVYKNKMSIKVGVDLYRLSLNTTEINRNY